jgi:hypothetical protein
MKRQKAELLYKLHKEIEKSKGKWTTKYNMETQLDDIKSEFTRIKAANDNDSTVQLLKEGLVLGVKGIEWANRSYDPLGVDLNGWGESFEYSKNDYTEILGEISEKYFSSKGNWPLEIRFAMMIGFSAVSFAVSKKLANDPETLANMMQYIPGMSNMLPKRPEKMTTDHISQMQSHQQNQSQSHHQQMPQMPQFQMPQHQMPQHQMPQHQMPQHQMPQHQMPQPMPQYQTQNQQFGMFHTKSGMPKFERSNMNIPSHADLMRERPISEDSDKIPSKMRGPMIDTPDSVHLDNIIKTMNDKKKQVEQLDVETDDSFLKEITPKGKGKAKKAVKKRVVSKGA